MIQTCLTRSSCHISFTTCTGGVAAETITNESVVAIKSENVYISGPTQVDTEILADTIEGNMYNGTVQAKVELNKVSCNKNVKAKVEHKTAVSRPEICRYYQGEFHGLDNGKTRELLCPAWGKN